MAMLPPHVSPALVSLLAGQAVQAIAPVAGWYVWRGQQAHAVVSFTPGARYL